MDAPHARKQPVTHSKHGLEWTDDYAWLREKESPEVLAHLQAENAYTQQQMAATQDLQSHIYGELLSRIQQTDVSVPVREGEYLYYARTEEGKQYPFYCRKRVEDNAAEEIYLDANALAAGHEYFRIGVHETSPNHQLLAYSTDTEGDEDYVIRIKDLRTGELLADEIPRTYYSLSWAADNQTLFYQVLDEARRPYRIYRHRLGTPTSADVLVYEEQDARFNVDVYRSRSGRFLLIESASSTSGEIRLLEADSPEGEFRVVRPRQPDIEYDLAHQGDSLYLRINDRGRNFRPRVNASG